MTPHKNPDQLQFLQNCSPDTRRQFLQLGESTACPKGHVCLREQDNNSHILFILDGKVQIYNLTKCGKKKILFILDSGHIANDNILRNSTSVYCETLEPCRFFCIRREDLLCLMEHDFQLTKVLFQYQERKLSRLEHQLKNTLGSIYLERRLASKLWKLARDFGLPDSRGTLIDMDLSITFLADLLGAPRETTSRICKKLADQGLIIMEKKKIYITDMDKIADFHQSQQKI
ncbi:MAG: Crp/Fnr family transcriptional regulator [Lachnospiraceae bacterium]|nr:Crp/Fnr family transcriptional regulator [Lachnospiraceae bacterium]